VIGEDCQPSLTDRVNLPYTNATIMEIQRMGDIGEYVNTFKCVINYLTSSISHQNITVPEGIFHMSMSPVKAGPYIIPPGHMIMPSLTAILKGPNGWREPNKFNPSR
jgi:cytochrome P450 family 2 subfamily U polypeptide 1